MTRNGWILFTIILRGFGISVIPLYPLLGMILSFFFDWIDAIILIQIAGMSRMNYHRIDKAIDQFWSLVMLAVGWNSGIRMLLLVLFLYRFIGYCVTLYRKSTRYYVFFPNIFEFVFLWFIGISPHTGISLNIFFVVFVSFVIKELQEFGLHIWWPAKLDEFRRSGGYPAWLRRLGWYNLG